VTLPATDQAAAVDAIQDHPMASKAALSFRCSRGAGAPAASARLTLQDQRIPEDVHDHPHWLLTCRTNQSRPMNVRHG
jgi:hypothetical protein